MLAWCSDAGEEVGAARAGRVACCRLRAFYSPVLPARQVHHHHCVRRCRPIQALPVCGAVPCCCFQANATPLALGKGGGGGMGQSPSKRDEGCPRHPRIRILLQ